MNTHGLRSIAFLAVAVSCLHAARANDKDISDLTVSSANVNRLQSWSLGPTGMRGCLSSSPGPAERFPGEGRISFLHGEFTSTSRQILVVDIGPKTPADGVMQVDDVILGAGGTLFTSDARKSLARAIQEAEKEEHKGILRLTRWRAGKTEEVELKLNVMGTYAATAPYDCPKSKRIFEDACQVLAREPSKDAPYGFWSINGLALLATGDPQYLPVVREYARNLAPRDLHLQGCYPWGWAYNGLFLCEYYLLTRDEEVLHGIREYTMALARGQGMFGTFGHGGSIRTTAGKLHGPIPPYGPVNQSGLGANLAIVMGKKCGIEHPMVDEAIERANGFFGYYVNKGTIPYGEHEPYDYHDNNGKSAMAAVFFAVQGNRVPEARFFAKMATAGYLNREVGHTGQGFSYLWNMMGPNVGGPRAAAAFFKEASWHYDLVRRCDGDFIYDGGEQCGPGFKDEKYFGKARYFGISPAATYVLTYALPLKKLCITGRESKPETWLSENDVSEAIASGRFHLDRATKTPKELVAALGDWSPVVRGYAADELALRPEAKGMVSELIALAEGPDANVRQAACRALGGLKDAAALPVLGKRLSDPDTWVRAMAARALKNFGAAAGPQVNTMLAALAANAKPATPIDWSDPLQFSNGFLAQTVFGTVLAKELSAAPKDLLYPAIRAGLELPTGFFRGAAAVALRDNLSVADIQALAPEIFEAIREQAPADRMFAGGPPAVGMNAMAKYLVKEGIELSVANGQIGPAALEVLPRYGDAARWTLPMLQEKLLEWDPKSGAYTGLVNCIESIRNATTAPPLVSCLPVANPQVVAAKEAKLVTLTGVAPDNGPLTFAIIEEPAHGTLSGTPPSVTYTPADGYQGTDRFTFKVTRETTRGKLESPPGTVSLIVGAVGTGLRGEYVKSGKRIAKRVDPTVDFDWSKLPDAEKIDSADIKIQWTGEVLAPETGTYVFSTLNAGGVRLWVNGLRVINDPKDRPARWTDGAPVNLVEGQRYDVKLACFKKIPGPAMMKLKWTGPSFAGKNGVTVGQEWLSVSQAESKPDTPPEPLVQQVTTSKDMPKVIVLDTGWNATEPLAYEITTKPAHGSLGGEPPTLTYTPAQGFVGDDRFTYRITRGKTSLPAETVGIAVLSADPGPAVTNAAGKTAPPAAMLSFGLPGQPADFIGSRLPGQRDDIVGSRVIWPVPSTATLENLAPVFTLAPGMTCDRASGSSNDFSTVQTYGVTDAEGEETLYQVLAAKVVIDAGATQKITDEKQLGSPAVIMKGGTINPIAPLTPKTTIILAPGTSNTIDSSPGAHEAVRVTCTITGEGSLVVAGDRSVYMSNTPNDYTGGTRITLSSGARFLVDGNRQFGTGLVTFAGTGGPVLMSVGSSNPVEVRNDLRLESDLVYSQTYNTIPLSLKGDIKGPGSLTKTFDPNDRGTRLVLLGKNSTYSGGTIFRSGYLDVLNARSLGSGPVTMGGKASPEHVVAFANMSPMTLANNVVLAGITEGPAPNPEALTEFLVSQHLELAGGISGTGGLLKTGPKTLTLSGVNTATGPTRIEAGELAVLGPISLGSGSLEIADGAKIRLNYEGTRRIAALSVAGKALPPGTYGSAASPATNKDDKHFSGTGTVTVQ